MSCEFTLPLQHMEIVPFSHNDEHSSVPLFKVTQFMSSERAYGTSY